MSKVDQERFWLAARWIVQDYSSAPDIGLIAVTVVTTLKNFGRNVVRSATKCSGDREMMHTCYINGNRRPWAVPSPVIVVLQTSSKPKVADLEVQLGVEENVAKLKVTMYDAPAMHVGDGFKKLHHVILYFSFRESFASLDQVGQALFGA